MKFSIRDLLLVTVIVALAAGWWVDRSRLTDEVKKLREPDYKAYQRGGSPQSLPIGDY